MQNIIFFHAFDIFRDLSWKSGVGAGTYGDIHTGNHKTAVSSNESKADQAAQSPCDDAPGLAKFCQFVSGTPVPPQQPIRVRFSTDDNQTLPVA